MAEPFTIPSSWVWTTLGEIADVVGGVTKDSKRQNDPDYVEVPYLRVANVQRGYLELGNVATIRVPEEKASRLRLQRGDVLLNEGGDRDKLGRGWIWEEQIPGCIHQNHVFRARVLGGVLDPKLLAWHANTFGQQWFQQHGLQSVNLASISLSKIKEFPVPVPPLAEQRRIVDAVDSLLSGVSGGYSLAKSALSSIDNYWNSGSARLLAEAYGEEGVLEEMVDGVVDCEHSTPKFVTSSDYPCLDTTCIRPGEIVRDRIRFVAEATYVQRVRRMVPREGDIVFAREGTVGTAVALPSDIRACLGQRVVLIRPGKAFNPKFLELLLNSQYVRAQWRGKVLGTTAPHLNLRDIRALRVNCPPLDVQTRLATDVEVLESNIRHAKRAFASVLARIDVLRRSVMLSAFCGDLTRQDPNDEPASELLARVRAERAAAVPVKRQRAARAPRTRKELAAPPTRVTGDNYEQGALPL